MLLLDAKTAQTSLYRGSLLELDPSADGTGPVSFSYLDIGPFHEEDMTLEVVEHKGPQLPYDGVLGADFLDRHPYRINVDKEIINWELD